MPLRMQLCDARGNNVSTPAVLVSAVQVLRLSDQAAAPSLFCA